jgi:hypothetical protein
MMKRPIVVYTGQGLSLADEFNLTRELRWLKGHCFAEVNDPWNLDEVLLLLRDRTTDEDHALKRGYLYEVLDTLDLLCAHEAYLRRTPALKTTAALCERLSLLADDRLVVLFTSNLDCVARYEAVKHRTTWLLGDQLSGLRMWDATEKWLNDIAKRERGFHYLPLHGEAGLVSIGPGGSAAHATSDVSAALTLTGPWGRTTGEGLGRNVTMIEQRMHISQAGYRLFRALLAGADFDAALHNAIAQDGGVPPERRSALVAPDMTNAAHLLTIGYGAPHSLGGRAYPFETSVDLVHKTVRARAWGAHWTAIVGPGSPSRPWFADHGFCVENVIDGTPNTCAALVTKALEEFEAAG